MLAPFGTSFSFSVTGNGLGCPTNGLITLSALALRLSSEADESVDSPAVELPDSPVVAAELLELSLELPPPPHAVRNSAKPRQANTVRLIFLLALSNDFSSI
jgi:hypothetical protein